MKFSATPMHRTREYSVDSISNAELNNTIEFDLCGDHNLFRLPEEYDFRYVQEVPEKNIKRKTLETYYIDQLHIR